MAPQAGTSGGGQRQLMKRQIKRNKLSSELERPEQKPRRSVRAYDQVWNCGWWGHRHRQGGGAVHPLANNRGIPGGAHATPGCRYGIGHRNVEPSGQPANTPTVGNITMPRRGGVWPLNKCMAPNGIRTRKGEPSRAQTNQINVRGNGRNLLW